jgi:hypothetical protein
MLIRYAVPEADFRVAPFVQIRAITGIICEVIAVVFIAAETGRARRLFRRFLASEKAARLFVRFLWDIVPLATEPISDPLDGM